MTRRVETQPALEGEALFVSQLAAIDSVISFVCARHHLQQADADDFASHVKLKLIEDDYAIFRKFERRSSIRSYLTVVIQRIFLDYRISAWGKWRPSAEAKRRGPVAVLIEQLIGRDGLHVEEAFEATTTNHRVLIDRSQFDRIVASLPVRAKRRFESDEALQHVASPSPSPDDEAADRERRALAERVSTALQRAIREFPTRDRLILTMRFEDGRALSEIAAALRLDQKALYRHVNRLLGNLRKNLEAGGIESSCVMEMLDSAAVNIEWEPQGESVLERPSITSGAK